MSGVGRKMHAPWLTSSHKSFMHLRQAAADKWFVRVAAVRKFLGKLDVTVNKGDLLRFNVDHRFNTYDFHGTKRVMFTTQGSFGNRNLTFGLVWLVMGVWCGIITVTFLLVGWRQLWSARERVAFLKQRWDKGRVGVSHRTARPASPPLETR